MVNIKINSDIIKLNEYNMIYTIISFYFWFFFRKFYFKKNNINVFKSINILPFDLFYQNIGLVLFYYFLFFLSIYINKFFYSIHQKGISEQNYFVTNLFKTFIVLLIHFLFQS